MQPPARCSNHWCVYIDQCGYPHFLFVFLKGNIKVYGINQKFEIVNARFLKEHSKTFYIEYPQNMWG